MPLRFDYEINTGEFTFEWVVPHASSNSPADAGGPSVHTPPRTGMPALTTDRTEIYVPAQLTTGRELVVRGLQPEDRWTYDAAAQTLVIRPALNAPGTVHRITVAVSPLPKDAFVLNDFWSDFGGHVFLASAVLCAVAALLATWLMGGFAVAA